MGFQLGGSLPSYPGNGVNFHGFSAVEEIASVRPLVTVFPLLPDYGSPFS